MPVGSRAPHSCSVTTPQAAQGEKMWWKTSRAAQEPAHHSQDGPIQLSGLCTNPLPLGSHSSTRCFSSMPSKAHAANPTVPTASQRITVHWKQPFFFFFFLVPHRCGSLSAGDWQHEVRVSVLSDVQRAKCSSLGAGTWPTCHARHALIAVNGLLHTAPWGTGTLLALLSLVSCRSISWHFDKGSGEARKAFFVINRHQVKLGVQDALTSYTRPWSSPACFSYSKHSFCKMTVQVNLEFETAAWQSRARL